MSNDTKWSDWYRRERPKFENFTEKMVQLMTDLLKTAEIQNTLEFRTKTVEGFSEKINRATKSYDDPSREVTDLSALRIIVRTKSDLEKVSNILCSELAVDMARSVKKSELYESNEFGYLSEHYVVAISKNRVSLTEWAPFEDLFAEIQVRTILQHAWATISHTIEYKKDVDIPKELRRRFFRLSALFELADDELDTIVLDSNRLFGEYLDKIQQSPTGVELNVDSINAYLTSSETVDYWAKFVEDLGVRIGSPGMVSRDILMAHRVGLKTIDEIDSLLDSSTPGAQDYLVEFFKNTFEHPDPKRHSMDINGIITLFLIAKFQNVFTDKVLNDELGWRKPERATVPAKKYIDAK